MLFCPRHACGWAPAHSMCCSFNPSLTVLHLHQPSPHPFHSMIFSVLGLHPSTSALLLFSLRPPSSRRSLSPGPSGLCRHISPSHLVSFPLTLEQMAGPCSLCVSLTDRGWPSTSVDDSSCAAPLCLFSPSSCPLCSPPNLLCTSVLLHAFPSLPPPCSKCSSLSLLATCFVC